MNNKQHRITAIINARAGQCSKRGDLIEHLNSIYPGLTCIFPENPLQTTLYTREALAAGYEMIISAGGDGTLHYVLNGFFDENGTMINPDAVLEICPMGTANDFYRYLVSRSQSYGNGEIEKIDIGLIHTISSSGEEQRKYFINICDIGLGALVASRINTPANNRRGLFKHLAEAMRCGWSYSAKSVSLELDGNTSEKKVKMVVVANGSTFGGGMCVAPYAEANDGLFDIVILGDISYWTGLQYLWSVITKKQFSHPLVEYGRAKNIRLTAKNEMLIEADGELPGTAPFYAEILPGVLSLRTIERPSATEK